MKVSRQACDRRKRDRAVRRSLRKKHRGKSWLCHCLSLFGGSLVCFGQTNSLSMNSALPDVGTSVFRLTGAFGFVIALFLASVWLFRNWRRLSPAGRRGPKLVVHETKSLGGRHALYVVGYEQQRLLLAASPGGVTLVSHLPAAEVEPESSVVPMPSFPVALQEMLSRKT